jgi:tetratricopeptide (TPR) repeat protein
LREANARRPDDFWIKFELGNFLALAAGPEAKDEVIRYYTAAVALRPRSVAALYNLGTAFLDKGRPDEAIAEYRRAIELKPDLERAYAGLGIAFLSKGRPDEAIAEYRKAVGRGLAGEVTFISDDCKK